MQNVKYLDTIRIKIFVKTKKKKREAFFIVCCTVYFHKLIAKYIKSISKMSKVSAMIKREKEKKRESCN